jgi:hypothetical protein
MRIKVRVVPRAKKARIEESEGGLKVYIQEPAIEGKANAKLIETLAEYYGVKKYNVEIILGDKQRDKIVEIKNEITR